MILVRSNGKGASSRAFWAGGVNYCNLDQQRKLLIALKHEPLRVELEYYQH